MMACSQPIPGEALKAEKMPGHWLLARLGKRVLRPGGRQLTCRMIEALNVQPDDAVIEFAPGLGETARLTLKRKPASYAAVERDEDAAALVQRFLHGPEQRCVVGFAEYTGLPDAAATVVYGEAMLSMQPPQHKEQIVREACRLLKPGGRYGIHELCLIPNDLDDNAKVEIQTELAAAIHHGTRPLTIAEWQSLLESEGFSVRACAQAPMHLLEPGRIIQDEGVFGTLRFAVNLLVNREARRRVVAMRRVFAKYRDHLAAVVLIGQKKGEVRNDRQMPFGFVKRSSYGNRFRRLLVVAVDEVVLQPQQLVEGPERSHFRPARSPGSRWCWSEHRRQSRAGHSSVPRDERSEHGGSGVNRSHLLRSEAHELGQVVESVAEVGFQPWYVDVNHRCASRMRALTASS
jgi:SAM-dependent methyltransferase